ncbi:MAG: autotransporter domain-containing protein [Thermoguttaceae bacterium]
MKRSRLSILLTTQSLRNSLRSQCVYTVIVTLVAIAMIVPMPVMAEVTATGGAAGPGTVAPGPNQTGTYYITPTAPPTSIDIKWGTGGTPATNVPAGGDVHTGGILTWGGGLNVNAGNRWQWTTPFDGGNFARTSTLFLEYGANGGNGVPNFNGDLTITGGINVNAVNTRPNSGDPPPWVPSRLIIQGIGSQLNFVGGGGLNATGGSRVDFLRSISILGVHNANFNAGGGGVINIASSEWRISGGNGGGGRVNVGAQFGETAGMLGAPDLFINNRFSTIIRAVDVQGQAASGSIGNNLHFYSNFVQDPTTAVWRGTQQIEVGGSSTLTFGGNVVADVDDTGIQPVVVSDVIKIGTGTLAFNGATTTRTGLLDIQNGTVAFTSGGNLGNLGTGDVRLNGMQYDPRNPTNQNTALDFRGFFTAINNKIDLLGTGQYAGGTIGVANAGATLTTTGLITVANQGTMQKTGAGRLDIQGTTTRAGLLDIIGGDVRIGLGGAGAQTNLGIGDVRLNGIGTSLTYSGAAAASISNRITLKNGGAIAVSTGAGVFELTGKMDGSGTLVKSEDGVLFLNGQMGSTIDLSIMGGTVRFAKRESLVTRSITLNGTDTILEYIPNSSLTIGNQIILANGGGQIKVTAATGELTLTGTVVDSVVNNVRIPGSLWKTGAGTLVLSGLASFSGEMYIKEGTLDVRRRDILSNASGLRMETSTTFLMNTVGAHQTLHGLNGPVGATIKTGDNTLTLNLRGKNTFEGALHGNAGTSSLIITAVEGQGVDSNNVPITIPAELTLNLGGFHGNLRFKQGTKLLDTNDNPNPTLFVVGTQVWQPGQTLVPGRPGVRSTLTFDLTTGAMPLNADPTQYPNHSNPFGVSVGAGGVDFDATDFRVWIDSQVPNGKYHAGHIETVGQLLNPPDENDVRKTLFQSTWVDKDVISPVKSVDVYTNFTGFSGLNNKLVEFGYSGLTENQAEVAVNIDRFRIIPTSKDHGMLDMVTAVINAEDQTTNLDTTVANLKDLLTQLSGDVYANSMLIAQHRPWQFAYQRLTLDSEMYFRGGEATSRGETLRGQSVRGQSVSLARMNRIWVSPTYSGTSITSDGNARGATVDRVGFQMGYDRRIRHNATAGVLFGYNNSCLKQWSDRVNVGDVQLGAYFSGMFGYYIEMRGYGGIGLQSYESTRIIDNLGWLGYNSRMSATGKTAGWAGYANVEFARPLFFGMFILRPTLAFDYAHAARNAFDETGDAIALRVGRTTAGRFATRFGFSMETGTTRRVSVTARLFGGAQFGGDNVKVNTQFVGIGAYPVQSIHGVKSEWAFLEGGIGTRCYLNNTRTMAFHADYDGAGSKNIGNHALSCGFSWMY